MTASTHYDHDFYAWVNEQAGLLRAGKLEQVDILNIAEEIESLGRAERRLFADHLVDLLRHLLQWQFQPEQRSRSWEAAIRLQRRGVQRLLRDSPSLEMQLGDVISDAYGDARIEAEGETGLSEETFPPFCPWSFGQIMVDDFWPGSETS